MKREHVQQGQTLNMSHVKHAHATNMLEREWCWNHRQKPGRASLHVGTRTYGCGSVYSRTISKSSSTKRGKCVCLCCHIFRSRSMPCTFLWLNPARNWKSKHSQRSDPCHAVWTAEWGMWVHLESKWTNHYFCIPSYGDGLECRHFIE